MSKWLTFQKFLQDHAIQLVTVNPFTVNRSMELDDNSPEKSDLKDPKTIALLVKDGRYSTSYDKYGLILSCINKFQLCTLPGAQEQKTRKRKMYLIAGLGNPGTKYEGTRHNIGWQVIDELAEKYNIRVLENKFKGLTGKGMIGSEKVLLLKPLTYMNLSGESIAEAVRFYKIDETTELIVIADDISLDVGQIRIRKKGSAGGHNGLKNIIAQLGHENFARIKMGVGEKPAGYDLADYVLGHFSKEEEKIMAESRKTAVKAIETILAEDIDKAMNLYNSKKNQKD